MNTHQPPGHRSGEGTSELWSLIHEDDKRKRPSANEALRKPIGDAEYRRVHGDVLRKPRNPGA